jgi:hypothetical protein
MKRYLFSTALVTVAGVAGLLAVLAFREAFVVEPIDLENPPPWNRPIEARQRTGVSPEEIARRNGERVEDAMDDAP